MTVHLSQSAMPNFTVDVSCCSVTPTARTIFLVVDAILFVAITIGNTLVILSVVKYRHMQTPTNTFLSSLAVADLFVAFFCLPVDAIFGLNLISDVAVSPWLCTGASSLTTISFSVSLNHLTVVAYDRFLAITQPLRYRQRMTSVRVVRLVGGSWAIGLIFGLLPVFGWNQISSYDLDYCDLLFIQAFGYRCFAIFALALLPINLMGYMYYRIFRVAREHSRRIAAEDRVFRRGERSLARDLKAAKTLAFILGTFLLAVTPAAIVSVADSIFPVSELFFYEIIAFHILFCNSAVNPVTYAFRGREFAQAFVKLLSSLWQCKRQVMVGPRQSKVHDSRVADISQTDDYSHSTVTKNTSKKHRLGTI